MILSASLDLPAVLENNACPSNNLITARLLVITALPRKLYKVWLRLLAQICASWQPFHSCRCHNGICQPSLESLESVVGIACFVLPRSVFSKDMAVLAPDVLLENITQCMKTEGRTSTVAPAGVSGSLKIPAEQAECTRREQHMKPHVRPASSKEIFGGQDCLPRGHHTCGLLGVKAHVLQQNAYSMLPAHPNRLAKKPEHWTLQCAKEHGDCQAPSGRAPATRSTTPDIAGQPILEGKA